MSRSPIGECGRYPTTNVLKSVSRTMPRAADSVYLPVVTKAKQVMASYADMEEPIRVVAYRPGSSREVDVAFARHRRLEEFLGQAKNETTSLPEGYRRQQESLAVMETEK